MNRLKQRALNWLREQRIENGCNRVYGLEEIASAVESTVLELYDRNTDSGVLYEMWQEGQVGLTFGDKPCAFAQGGRMDWD